MNESEPRSNNASKKADWLDLDLPGGPDSSDAPIDREEPSSEAIYRHNLMLSLSQPESVWEERRKRMYPVRFEM